MATTTSPALNRITVYLLVSGRAGVLPMGSAWSAAFGAVTARVLGNRVLACRRGGAGSTVTDGRLAEACRKLRRGRRRHGRERAAVGHAGFQVAELSLKVSLQPAAILTLKRSQVVNPALELLALLNKRTHGLAVPLLGIPLQALGARPGVAGDLLRLAASLRQHLVRLAAGTAERLVGFPAGVGDGLVGGLLGQRQHPGRGVHVVLDRVMHPVHHHGLRPALLRRLRYVRVLLGVGQR